MSKVEKNVYKVMKELIAAQHEIAELAGRRLLASDEELASSLLDYFSKCPSCGEPLNFKPVVAIAMCENRAHFIALYGLALTHHYQDYPQCEGIENSTTQDFAVKKYLMRKLKNLNLNDLDRWIP